MLLGILTAPLWANGNSEKNFVTDDSLKVILLFPENPGDKPFLDSANAGMELIKQQDAAKAIEETNKISRQYNLKIAPSAKVSGISVAMMQKLDILQALYRGVKILSLDEPTAILIPQKTVELSKGLLDFKAKDHTIIFISQ